MITSVNIASDQMVQSVFGEPLIIYKQTVKKGIATCLVEFRQESDLSNVSFYEVVLKNERNIFL